MAPNPVYLHVDARADSGTWEAFRALAARSEGVQLLERVRTGWASWGLVSAALVGIAQSAASPSSHVVVLSGQDYLLRPVAEISAYFRERPLTSWIPSEPIPVTYISDKDGGRSRVTYWHFPVRGRRLRLPARRRAPQGVVPRYGQAQCVISAPLGRWIVEEVARRPELVRFFRRVSLPDEWFFTSMAQASPGAAEVSGANLWYTDWSAGGAHPKTFGAADVPSLLAVSEGRATGLPGGDLKFFARKFDMARDPAAMDALDNRLLAPPSVTS
jgi:hypothetical protein